LLYSEIIDLCAIGSWAEITHDDTVTWLAKWRDPIKPNKFKNVSLAASSSWKGQSDKEKYEKARMLKVCSILFILVILHFQMIFCMIFKRTILIMEYLDIFVQSHIGKIRAAYTKGFTSKDITKQQIAVATYFIDKLALRAGNEKVQI
jgi:DNA topoisomerase-1